MTDPLVPPHNDQAEQSLLGGLMLDPSAWDAIADKVGEADFYRREHRLIFAAMQHLEAAGQPFDMVTVAEALERSHQLEVAGGMPYLGAIAKETPSAANVKAYAKIVREHSVQRQLVAMAGTISAMALNPQGREAQPSSTRPSDGCSRLQRPQPEAAAASSLRERCSVKRSTASNACFSATSR